MNRLAGLAALLLLAGCSATPGVAAPAATVTPAPPAISATVKLRPESLLKLPLGTVVDQDTSTVTVLSDEGAVMVTGKRLWAVRARSCISPDAMTTDLPTKYRWYASDDTGRRYDAEEAKGTYGSAPVSHGNCAEGPIHFAIPSRPDRIWYASAVGMIGWKL